MTESTENGVPNETQTEKEEIAETAPNSDRDLQAEIDKWKALSRKNEERAKTNEQAAKRLSELEEGQKSEIEKAMARADEAERRAALVELEALRASVALNKGLTPSQAKRLVGATLEELETDADELIADLKANKPAKAPSSDGQGVQGEKVGTGAQIVSRDQLKDMTREEINRAREDGRLDKLLGRQ